MSDQLEADRPPLRLIRGDASPEEIAALVAALLSPKARPLRRAPGRRSGWIPPDGCADPCARVSVRGARPSFHSHLDDHGAVVNQTLSAHASRSDPKGRIVLATPGQDGHDPGAEVVARALRDAGYEVIYTGPGQTPAQIVATVIAEDASILGLSILSGTHMTIVARVIEFLAQKGASDTAVLVSGVIPPEDAFALEILGARRVFTPGTTREEVVEAVDHLNDIYGSIVRAS